jgi:hypothetical protein
MTSTPLGMRLFLDVHPAGDVVGAAGVGQSLTGLVAPGVVFIIVGL